MKVVASYSIKGGVGKTTAAVNLAYLAARDGFRTLLWDLDPQGAATFVFRVRPKVKGGARGVVRRRRPVVDAVKETDFEGLDLVPSDPSNRDLDILLDATRRPAGTLRRVLRPLAEAYDLVVLDCAPSISLTSENVLRAADVLAVPLLASPLSLRTFDQLAGFVADGRRRGPRVVAYFSMVDRRRRLQRELVEAGYPGVSGLCIPAVSQVEQMASRRAPLAAFAPSNPAAVAYDELWGLVRRSARLKD